MELLYLYGAELNIQDRTGMTPLHVCAMWDLRAQARWLFSRGADVRVKDKFGDTPLHTSAVFGSINVGKYIKNIDNLIGEKNNEGLTPVELAKKYRNQNWIDEVGDRSGE